MKNILLIGNASYLNRGCEAITRGTVEILKKQFGQCKFTCASSFESEKELKNQIDKEFDEDITHISINNLYKIKRRYSLKWIKHVFIYNIMGKINKKFKFNYIYENVVDIKNYDFILCVGGDNYSLDYGYPYFYTDFAEYAIKKNKKVYLWGASVGPFDKDKNFERYMSEHLNRYNKIFVREDKTINYLKGICVKNNVEKIMDPAFIMNSIKPNKHEIIVNNEELSIGFNVSSLMPKYITDGDYLKYVNLNKDIINKLLKDNKKTIYLIPHVTVNNADDYVILKDIYELVEDKSRVILVDKNFNASELKWIIGKMNMFIGARTHATIAAFSQGVPTISLVYSMKAIGINMELFGSKEYCINPEEYTVENIVLKVDNMLKKREEISNKLLNKITWAKKEALKAGEILSESIVEV